MHLLELPTEVLCHICRLLVAKNSGDRPTTDITSTVILKYIPSCNENQSCKRLVKPAYSANTQVLRVCRRLHDISVHIIYGRLGDNRFSCLQPELFILTFGSEIGESNLSKIAQLHLRIPGFCRTAGDDASTELVDFLVSRMRGLRILELSKRWMEGTQDCFQTQEGVEGSKERTALLWLSRTLLRQHRPLNCFTWTKTSTTSPYPDDEEDGPVWTIVLVTLSVNDQKHSQIGHSSRLKTIPGPHKESYLIEATDSTQNTNVSFT
jgi:hypothetical protein